MDIEDHKQLVDYLKDEGHLEMDEVPLVRTLAGGISNRTVLIERLSWPGIVVKQALSKLRVKEDWFSDPSRIHHEAEGLRLLLEVAPDGMIVPLIFEDQAFQLLGMIAVGNPHTNWKQDLLEGNIDSEIVTQFGRCLGQIHSKFDVATYPTDGLLHRQVFFESLRLEPYYLFAASRVPVASTFFQALVDETRGFKLTLVHGDYSPKNVLVKSGRMILLDHEVIHIGDPAFDVGFSMTHLLAKAIHVAGCKTAFGEAAQLYWMTYREAIQHVPWLEGLEARAVKHTLACLLARVAGRSPLEYLTQNEKAKQLDAVRHLIDAPPVRIPGLIEQFLNLIELS